MSERFKEYKREQDYQTCDRCYKTDVDFLIETRQSGVWWNDTKYGELVCDDCKKHEEKLLTK